MLRLLVLTAVTNVVRFNYSAVAINMSVIAVDFEVFGRVQGVFFRKIYCKKKDGASLYPSYTSGTSDILHNTAKLRSNIDIDEAFTKDQAEKLGLRGWCKNTSQGTVLGHVEGPSDKVESMVHWLKTTGSPSSKIDKTEFKNQKDITEYTFENFGIRKD